MQQEGQRPPPRVVFLFTTFPVISETFLQREVEVLRASGMDFGLVSLWGGGTEWNGLKVQRHGLGGALAGLVCLPLWLIRRPQAAWQLIRWLLPPRRSGLLNWAENLLGASYALLRAGALRRAGVTHLHAVWASAPAMAALATRQLAGISFSFGAHAYDLFERGGDGWLREKLAHAAFVRTSTRAGVERLLQAGAGPASVKLIRRGLVELPPFAAEYRPHTPVRILSVGRMVEKMGFARQIPLLQQLAAAGLDFTVTWIGDGPQRRALEAAVRAAGLAGRITFAGALPYAEVEQAYARHDLFFFTGQTDRRGDRAGLPNAVAEAMAWGLPVFATRVGGVAEAVSDGLTGCLWEGDPRAASVLAFLRDPALQQALRRNARHWIELNYDARRNLGPLIALFGHATFYHPKG